MREKYIIRRRDDLPFACGIRYSVEDQEFMIGGPRSFILRMQDIAGLFDVHFDLEDWDRESKSRFQLVIEGLLERDWSEGLRLLWDAGYKYERVVSFRRLVR